MNVFTVLNRYEIIIYEKNNSTLIIRLIVYLCIQMALIISYKSKT